MPINIYSVSRFLRRKTEVFPCYVAGRGVFKTEKCFELHSQGQSLLCESSDAIPSSVSKSTWLCVEIEKKEAEVYRVKSFKPLEFSVPAGKNPKAFPVSFKKDWDSFLNSVKEFFEKEGLLFVQTPSLVECPGVESHLEPFETEWECEGKKERKFLPTSPEMHLKKLLCHGFTDIFEIKKCFRNGELSSTHEPEFFLLEWYRAFFSLEDLIEELERFFKYLQTQPFFKGELKPFQTKSVQELFIQHLNFPLQPDSTKEDLISLLKKHQCPFSAEDSWENLFHTLFLNQIEPFFPKEQPLIVKDYPPQLRALSQINGEGWADRFELYWRGFELANAFYEVNDFEEQKMLFDSHLKNRDIPRDNELLSLMKEEGMPSSSGIALGLDRLFAALCLKDNISFFKFFSFQKY